MENLDFFSFFFLTGTFKAFNWPSKEFAESLLQKRPGVINQKPAYPPPITPHTHRHLISLHAGLTQAPSCEPSYLRC